MKPYGYLGSVILLSILGLGLFASSPSLYAQPVESSDGDKVAFQWAFGALKNESVDPLLEVISRDTILRSGDRIKFFLKLEKTCSVYLIYKSSQGEISLLFPFSANLASGQFRTLEPHYVPSKNRWFKLDTTTGTETFYLLASADRLNKLETLLSTYQGADTLKKDKIGTEILTEIRKLRKQHFKFKSYAERPVAIIGNMRGSEKTSVSGMVDLADHAIKISAKNFFSRTFTIDHQ